MAAAVESRMRGRYTALSRVPAHSGGWRHAPLPRGGRRTFTGHDLCSGPKPFAGPQIFLSAPKRT